jgi:hypothetical protein
VHRVNLDAIELQRHPSAPAGFGARGASIHPEIGGEHPAGSVTEIRPGTRAWPGHGDGE